MGTGSGKFAEVLEGNGDFMTTGRSELLISTSPVFIIEKNRRELTMSIC